MQAARLAEMEVKDARSYFEALAGMTTPQPWLRGSVGTWQLDVEGAGTWSVAVDHGALTVSKGPAKKPTARLKLDEPELVRLARGEAHENLVTALLRGRVVLEGDLAFAQGLRAILPLDQSASPELEEKSS
jgi:putative sterol carrier protein